MIFLNKKTNIKWEINDDEHIRRLLNDEDYEVIEEKTETLEVKCNETKIVNLEEKPKAKKKVK